VHPLTLRTEQAQQLGRIRARAGEPVRDVGVELGGLAGRQDHVVFAENEPQPAGQHVQPLVSLVRAQVGIPGLLVRREDHLVRLETAGPAGQRDVGHAMPGERGGMDARIPGGRGADQLIKLHLMCPGQRQQQLEGGAALTGLQAGEGTDRDPGGLGKLRQRRAAILTQGTQPGADGVENVIKSRAFHITHANILPIRQQGLSNLRRLAEDDAMNDTYDVVIAGGGAAGLSAGLALARFRRSVLVVDEGSPRNAPARHMHNYLGFDGRPPGDLLAAGRIEVAGYGGEITTGTVTAAHALADKPGFLVELASGQQVRAQRLLVTTGLVDELPDVPGLRERWGRDVVHCPFCHGWEVRDQAIGILGTGPMTVHQAMLFRQLSDDVIVFQHTVPELSAEDRAILAGLGIGLVTGEVAGLEIGGDALTGVRLRSGEVIARQALVVAPRFTARAGLLASLGLEPAQMEVAGEVAGSYVPADPSGATAVPGVWVAGNVTNPMAQVIVAAGAGLSAAAAIIADIMSEEARLAAPA
jgi:thioredoxin reductase